MAGQSDDVVPIIVGIVLTSVCLTVTGEGFQNVVLLAGLPVGIRTYIILARRQAAGRPVTLRSALVVLMTSTTLTVGLAYLLIVGFFITAILKESDIGLLPLPFIIILATGLILLPLGLWKLYVDKFGPIKLDFLHDFEVRLTIRGILIGVAFFAFTLWPIHYVGMRPTYIAISNHEATIAGLCLAESQFMAERAELCRKRAADGMDWKLNDEVSEDLKLNAFSIRSLGRSWLEQADIWERAAERCREAGRRHEARSARYKPWLGSGEG